MDVLRELSDKMKSKVNAQFMSKREKYIKSANPGLDPATINQRMLEDFDALWSVMDSRLKIVPGKDLLSSLNEYLQEKYSVSLTHSLIIAVMKQDEVPSDIVSLLDSLECFRNKPI